jgi:hypothetical protein
LLSIGNATPIDIHIGGSATTVEIGNAASITTFNGNVSAAGNITLPDTRSINIGSLTISDDTIRSTEHNITIGSPGNIGNVIIGGNLTVNGNTTTINSNVVSTNDLTYNLANNATTSSQANGGGVEVGPVGNPYITWLYDNTSNVWVSSGGINANSTITGNILSAAGNIIATGNISGSRILGNAQQLGNVGQSFRVTNVDSADYIFNGVANDPTISLTRGQTYYFNMAAGNTHPLWIKTAPTQEQVTLTTLELPTTVSFQGAQLPSRCHGMLQIYCTTSANFMQAWVAYCR